MEGSFQIKKERRAFEDALRKNLILLESKGLHEEAKELIFTLRVKMGQKMALYLKEPEED